MLLGAAQLPQYLLLTLTQTYSPNFISYLTTNWNLWSCARSYFCYHTSTRNDWRSTTATRSSLQGKSKAQRYLQLYSQIICSRSRKIDWLEVSSLMDYGLIRDIQFVQSLSLLPLLMKSWSYFRILLASKRLGTFFTSLQLSYTCHKVDSPSAPSIKLFFLFPLSLMLSLWVELYKERFGITIFGVHWRCQCCSTALPISLKKSPTLNTRSLLFSRWVAVTDHRW